MKGRLRGQSGHGRKAVARRESESNHRPAVQRERKRESGPKLEFDDRFQFLPVSVDGCSLAQSLTHAARRAPSLGEESEDIYGENFPAQNESEMRESNGFSLVIILCVGSGALDERA